MSNKDEQTAREVYYECGICTCYHRLWFDGDCRNDAERLHLEQIPDDAEIIEMQDVDAFRAEVPNV